MQLLIEVTFDTLQLEISPLNAFAFENMYLIFVTCDTSHLEMSRKNDSALENIPPVAVTLDMHIPLPGHATTINR